MSKFKSISLKIVCCALICLFALGFCGCAQINAATISNDDGSIDEVVTIKLDNQQIEEAGENLAVLKVDIATRAEQIAEYFIVKFNESVYSNFQKRDLYGKMTKIDNMGWDGNVFTAGLHFKNMDAYRYFYGISDEATAEPTVEKHFLYDKIIVKGSTLYADYNALYTELYAYYSEKYPLLAETENQYSYTYVMDYRRQKSDADYVQKIDGKYYHTWLLNAGETNKVITIYYNLANRANCILVCIISSLALCTVLLTTGIITTKINAKRHGKN